MAPDLQRCELMDQTVVDVPLNQMDQQTQTGGHHTRSSSTTESAASTASTGTSGPTHPTHHHAQHARHHHHQHHRPIELVFQGLTVSIPTPPAPPKTPTGSLRPRQVLSWPLRKSPKDQLPVLDQDLPPPVAEKRLILNDVSGFARPGQMLGIMGPSGSGKTTLLSALSGRLKLDQGSIVLNQEPLSKQLRRKICYVLQQDTFFPDLTLRQTLVYTALLRLPDSMTHAQKLKHVDQIIDVLDLRHCQHTIIGDMMKRGLSGGEKKRTSIACELLNNPQIMLIDEPTSGLDSSTAHTLMQTLKDFAVKERKTMITTVHQPSSQIFHMFDKLLLLCGGRVAYFGHTKDVVPFFSRIGYEISAHYNPADFIMEKVKGPVQDQDKIVAAAKALPKSPMSARPSPRPSTAQDVHPQSLAHHLSSPNHNHHQTHQLIQSATILEEVTTAADHHLVDDGHDVLSSSYKSDLTDHHHHRHHSLEDPEDHDEPDRCESQELNEPLWTGHTDHFRQDQDHQDEKEMRVVIDSNEKIQKVYNRIVNDYDSGRSSWTETDRSSTATFSSTSGSVASTEEMYFDFSPQTSKTKRQQNQKWPTSFWTQVSVLTHRNFYEARGRFLSKLNWVQTVGLALVSGLIWMQVPRREESLNDLRGWMFWSMTYWMLHALFSAMVTFPPEREVINKERASGAYRLSAYYVAKMIGELPLTVALPTVFHCISYPLMGYSNFTTFALMWAFSILSIVVAQSVGLFIGAACMDLEVSVAIAALYSLSTMLFGGFYATTIPDWLSWMRYLSLVYYAFQNQQMVEFGYGPAILCSTANSKFSSCQAQNLTLGLEDRTIPYSELSRQLDVMSNGREPFPIWFNTIVLMMFLIGFRMAGYLVLRFIRKPK